MAQRTSSLVMPNVANTLVMENIDTEIGPTVLSGDVCRVSGNAAPN